MQIQNLILSQNFKVSLLKFSQVSSVYDWDLESNAQKCGIWTFLFLEVLGDFVWRMASKHSNVTQFYRRIFFNEYRQFEINFKACWILICSLYERVLFLHVFIEEFLVKSFQLFEEFELLSKKQLEKVTIFLLFHLKMLIYTLLLAICLSKS